MQWDTTVAATDTLHSNCTAISASTAHKAHKMHNQIRPCLYTAHTLPVVTVQISARRHWRVQVATLFDG